MNFSSIKINAVYAARIDDKLVSVRVTSKTQTVTNFSTRRRINGEIVGTKEQITDFDADKLLGEADKYAELKKAEEAARARRADLERRQSEARRAYADKLEALGLKLVYASGYSRDTQPRLSGYGDCVEVHVEGWPTE